MDEKAGEWKSQKLSFNDSNDIFAIWHHGPIAAIKSLWSYVQLSPEMVYAGCNFFSDVTQKDRIFSEMWKGKRWHVLQVRLY